MNLLDLDAFFLFSSKCHRVSCIVSCRLQADVVRQPKVAEVMGVASKDTPSRELSLSRVRPVEPFTDLTPDQTPGNDGNVTIDWTGNDVSRFFLALQFIISAKGCK